MKHVNYCPTSDSSEYRKMYLDYGHNFMEKKDYKNAEKMFCNAQDENLERIAQAY
jgi:hypothetical protein